VRFKVLAVIIIKKTVFWDVPLIALMMVGYRPIYTSEMSVNFYQTTRRNIPDGSAFMTGSV
jgi:hypothetical protein